MGISVVTDKLELNFTMNLLLNWNSSKLFLLSFYSFLRTKYCALHYIYLNWNKKLSKFDEIKTMYCFSICRYLADPTNLFIISSDFCHWGERFHYQYYDQTKGEIHQSIKALDFAVSHFFFLENELILGDKFNFSKKSLG